jgi:hypothetical protein
MAPALFNMAAECLTKIAANGQSNDPIIGGGWLCYNMMLIQW